jgi:hypothetical protein
MPTVSTYISLAITATSIVYQQVQARKQRAAADTRKGQFVVVDGQIIALPLVYGRALVGGARVYHTTSSKYIHAAVPADCDVFLGGKADGSSYTVTREGENGPEEVQMPATPGTVLDQNRDGSKNEFLYVQQALCIGPINKCYDVLIDESGTYNKEEYKPGLKIVVNREGDEADAMTAANSPAADGRDQAAFPDVAYASMCFKLNRDDPQYNGVPNVTFIIEGRKVRQIIPSGNTFVLGSPTYNNSPALCLLDYLLDEKYGRGLDVQDIDLASFFNVHLICMRPIPTTEVGGKIWKTTKPVAEGGRNVTSMQLPMFEANIVLDTSKSVRENVKDLLSTMGDARLIWSGGKYKLVLNYPHAFGDQTPVPHAIITDDDIVRESVEIQWPNLDTRQNFCTVRFANEAKDFKEDTATWPPRFGAVHNAFLEQDNGIPLETDIQGLGITTKVHATAKAEEIVRASRNAVLYNFSMVLHKAYFEPGDILKIESSALQLDNSAVYVQIDEIELNDEGIAKVRAVRYVPSQLAWNIDDNNIGVIPPEFTTIIPRPTNLAFTPKAAIPKSNKTLGEISGQLSWTRPFDGRIVGFKLYIGKAGEIGTTVGENGQLVSTQAQKFNDLGTASESPFDVPDLEPGRYVFGIRSVTAYGGMSEMATLTTSALIKDDPLPAPVGLTAEGLYFAIKLKWSQPSTLDLTRYSHTEIYRNTSGVAPVVNSNTGNVTNATKIGTDTGGNFQDTNPTKNIEFFYWVINVTKKGTKGQPSALAKAKVKSDPDNLLDLLTGVITQDHLWIDLANRINIIDMPNVGLVDRVNELFNTYGPTLSAAQSAAAAAISRNEAATFSASASQSAANAYQSEQLSTSASTNAGIAAGQANTFAAQAAGSAAAANISRNEAANSATTATNAASTATQKEAIATGAATTANQAAIDAANSKIAAESAKLASAASEAGALGYRNSAFNSATDALNAASTATEKAGIATTAATTATNKAGEAADYSANALSYRDAAAQSATTALGAQSVATDKAGIAAAAALTATNKAGEAQTYAADAGIKRDQAVQAAVNAEGHAIASAQSFTTLSARLDNAYGPNVSMEQAFVVAADSLTGLRAQYTVKIDNNGFVSGFGLASEPNQAGGSTSMFYIRADRFAVGSPNGGAYIPFVVTTSGTTDSYGNYIPPGVYMDNVTITRGNIQKGSIAASFGGASGAMSGSFSFYVGAGGADVVMAVGFSGYVQYGGGKDSWTGVATGSINFPGGGSVADAASGVFTAVGLGQGWHTISYSIGGYTVWGYSQGLAGASASWSATVLYR